MRQFAELQEFVRTRRQSAVTTMTTTLVEEAEEEENKTNRIEHQKVNALVKGIRRLACSGWLSPRLNNTLQSYQVVIYTLYSMSVVEDGNSIANAVKGDSRHVHLTHRTMRRLSTMYKTDAKKSLPLVSLRQLLGYHLRHYTAPVMFEEDCIEVGAVSCLPQPHDQSPLHHVYGPPRLHTTEWQQAVESTMKKMLSMRSLNEQFALCNLIRSDAITIALALITKVADAYHFRSSFHFPSTIAYLSDCHSRLSHMV